MGIHKCKASFWTSPSGLAMCSYDILYDGMKFRVSDVELDLLYKGTPPEDLDLVEITDSDEETEADERGDHFVRLMP
jgi:hypothetical protein